MASSHNQNETNPVPSGTVASSLPSGRQRDDLPEALRAGGAAEVALEHADEVKSSYEESELCKTLRSDLATIHQEYQDFEVRLGPRPATEDDWYWRVLTNCDAYYKANPVFRYALAFHGKIEKATERAVVGPSLQGVPGKTG